MQLHGIIIGDNFYQQPRTAIGRANGAHRIATILRKNGVHTEVIDFFNSWENEELLSLSKKIHTIDFLGLSVGLGLLNSDKVNYFIRLLKDKFPKIKIIAGGSVVLDKTYEGVDLYFKGFAEGAVPELIKYLQTNKFNPFNIQHIITHDVKKVVDCNQHYKNFDLINLQTEYTENDFINENEVLTLEVSRGCIFKCSFCTFPFTGKNKNEYIRLKENIKQELITNYQKYKVKKYLITDDTFNDNQLKVDMLYEISQELDFDLSLMCYARVDLLKAFEKNRQLDKMVAAGFKGMFFGIESFNPNTSKKIGKGFTGTKLKNYLLQIKQEYPDLHITGSFIAGLPGESASEFEDNIDWALSNDVIDSVTAWPLIIYVDNNINDTSAFSRDYLSYGYNKMSEEELNQIGFDNSTYSKHYVPWKNDHMTFLDAEKIVAQVRKKGEYYAKPSGWFGFMYSFHTNDLLKSMHTRKRDYDWNKQISLATKFVQEYKYKKLNTFEYKIKNENQNSLHRRSVFDYKPI